MTGTLFGGTLAAGPVGCHSAVRENGTHPADPVARPRRRSERTRHTDGAESGRCRCGRRRASRRRRDARRSSGARASPRRACWKFRRGRPDRSRTASASACITAAGTLPARVALGSGKELAAGTRAVAELRLEAPAFVFTGDHFTVRDWSEQHTLAGAVVLDPDATARRFAAGAAVVAGAGRRRRLRIRRVFSPPTSLVDGAVRRSQLLLKSRFSTEDLAAAVDRLVAEGRSCRWATSSPTRAPGRRPAGKRPRSSTPRIAPTPSISALPLSRSAARAPRRCCRSTSCSIR